MITAVVMNSILMPQVEMPMPPMPAPQQQQPAPPANILTQTWLDQNQYTKNGIQRYSEIFGRTYVSTGGETTTKEFTGQLGLKPGMKVGNRCLVEKENRTQLLYSLVQNCASSRLAADLTIANRCLR